MAHWTESEKQKLSGDRMFVGWCDHVVVCEWRLPLQSISREYHFVWGWFICSVMSDSVTTWTIAHQALVSMGFSRQKKEWVAISSSRGSS